MPNEQDNHCNSSLLLLRELSKMKNMFKCRRCPVKTRQRWRDFPKNSERSSVQAQWNYHCYLYCNYVHYLRAKTELLLYSWRPYHAAVAKHCFYLVFIRTQSQRLYECSKCRHHIENEDAAALLQHCRIFYWAHLAILQFSLSSPSVTVVELKANKFEVAAYFALKTLQILSSISSEVAHPS